MSTTLAIPIWPERGLDRFFAILERVREVWPFVGGEVRVPPDRWEVATEAVRELQSHGFTVAVHLPPPEEFRPEEFVAWLAAIRPDWAVVHGGTAAEGEVGDCEDFLRFLEDRAVRLKILSASGVPVFVENAPPREPVRDSDDPGTACDIRPLIRAGMFARDLLFLAERAGCRAVADTEHFLDAIFAVRKRARTNGTPRPTEAERKFAARFGFFVRGGKVFWAGDCLRSLTLEGELSVLRPARFHVTGSRAAASMGKITSHAELRDDPFGRYLISLVLFYRPLSITVEACHKDGIFDWRVLERSVLAAARMLKFELKQFAR